MPDCDILCRPKLAEKDRYESLLKIKKPTKDAHFSATTFTDWGEWGACNVTCGNGYQRKTRACSFQPCASTDLIRLRSCTKSCGKCHLVYHHLQLISEAERFSQTACDSTLAS